MNISIPSKKDWGKDFSHENGNTEYKNFDAMRVQNAQ